MAVNEFDSISDVGSVLGGYFSSPEVEAKLSENRRAFMAWNKVNGDVERAHTRGMYVTKPRRPGELPSLVVYVDSRMRAVDFSANRDTYLARLAAVGFRYSDLRFQQDKRAVGEKGLSPKAESTPKKKPARPLPELTAVERARVDDMCRSLPDGLRQSVSKALSNSMRREKLN